MATALRQGARNATQVPWAYPMTASTGTHIPFR